MKSMSKLAYLAASCALVVATVAFVGPRTVHAVVAALVRDVDNPARHPFQATCRSFVGDCRFTVPTGQELVINGATFSAFIDPGPGSQVQANLCTTVNAVFVCYTLGTQDLGPTLGVLNNPHQYTAILPFSTYADSGTQVIMVIQRGFLGINSITFDASISGYLVSVP